MISLDEAIRQQNKMLSEIEKLENHNTKSEANKKFRNEVLKNIKLVYNVRLDIIEGFENGLF